MFFFFLGLCKIKKSIGAVITLINNEKSIINYYIEQEKKEKKLKLPTSLPTSLPWLRIAFAALQSLPSTWFGS